MSVDILSLPMTRSFSLDDWVMLLLCISRGTRTSGIRRGVRETCIRGMILIYFLLCSTWFNRHMFDYWNIYHSIYVCVCVCACIAVHDIHKLMSDCYPHQTEAFGWKRIGAFAKMMRCELALFILAKVPKMQQWLREIRVDGTTAWILGLGCLSDSIWLHWPGLDWWLMDILWFSAEW